MLNQIEKIVLSSFKKKETISGSALRNRLFNKKRSAKMRALSVLEKWQRAFVIERIVGEEARKAGNEVVHYGGSSAFDILINGKRVEVKSALCRGKNKNFSDPKNAKYQQYTWSGIKPNNFDYLVIVAVTPNGLRYKMVDSDYVNNWCPTMVKYSTNGYNWYENGKYVRYHMKPISKLGEEINDMAYFDEYLKV
jgi:hypothetical protein